MSDQERPLFEGMDEYERTYAPEQLPPDDPEKKRASLEGSASKGNSTNLEPPATAPIGTLGSAPSGAMIPIIRRKDQDAEAKTTEGQTETGTEDDEG